VNEAGGLWMAHRLIPWWKKNNIYPIYFVWETGLGETLGQILLRGRRELARAVPRDLFDYTTDPLLERVARALRGELIWSGMKRSAERAAAPDGGARYVATKLKAFLDQQGASAPQLHAVGHSAGSIFHAYFVPAALEVGIPSFKTMSFLAPAIRVDTFLSRLAEPFVKSKIERLDIFTMTKDWEKADNCVGLYRKSLLYLIYAALEAEPKTPILGLEIALRENADLRAMFGLAGTPNPRGEVVWSKTRETTGTRASRSASHGGFDNDPPTMCSVAARILGLSDTVGLAPLPIAASWTGAPRSSGRRISSSSPGLKGATEPAAR
jgi:hypothetical protein